MKNTDNAVSCYWISEDKEEEEDEVVMPKAREALYGKKAEVPLPPLLF